MNINEKLRTVRKSRGLSLDTMAKLLGISRRSLCYYERGMHLPPKAASILTLEGLCGRLENVENTVPEKRP